MRQPAIRTALMVVLSTCFVLSLALPASSRIIYVKWDSPTNGSGDDWDHAFHSVQAGLNAAVSGDEVRVAGATDSQRQADPTAGKYVECITLSRGVALYGGYAGVGDTRDISAYETILDGDKQGTVVTCPEGADETTRVEGFTIRDGASQLGAGVYCYKSSPVIMDNKIIGCAATSMGGGIFCGGYLCCPTIQGNVITANTAFFSGAGICCYGSISPVIRDNTISGNSIEVYDGLGGGIYCQCQAVISEDTVIIENNVIIENTAPNAGGGIYAGGTGAQITIAGNTFRGNSANNGVLQCRGNTTKTIMDNTFLNNTGGAIRTNDSSPVIERNLIGFSGGDGICCTGGHPIVANNNIVGNDAGVSCEMSSASITNNVIAANTRGVACSGVAVVTVANNTVVENGSGISFGRDPAITVVNNIVAFNARGLRQSGNVTHVLRTNCVHGNTEYDYSPGLSPGAGDIGLDPPKFASISYGNLHIQPDSPCRDAGDNSVVGADWVDMDGQPRILPVDGMVDIGADESDGTAWSDAPSSTVYVSPEGDDGNDGYSWSSAKRTVQAGIDAAAARCADVWVKAGVYHERIALRPYTHLYGGFDGTETDRSQRNWKVNTTVLDGQQSGSVVVASGSFSTIDGFTIQNGKDTYDADGGMAGGIRSGPSTTIANNTITKCIGYGIDVLSGSPTIVGNIIVGNTPGGVNCYESSSPKILGNTLAGNSGTAICCFTGVQATIINNIVAHNLAGIHRSSSGEFQVLHSNCVYGNSAFDYFGWPEDPTGTDGNISIDPKLASLAFGDVHIQPDSACVDAGDDAAASSVLKDVDGEDRVHGAHVDIGADESDGTTWNIVPEVVCVTPTGDDENDGSGWSDDHAKRTVQAAINTASAVGGEVWVKADVYNERVTLLPFAHLYGGFQGTETQKSQRNWTANVTTLDGQNGGSVVTAWMGHGVNTIDGFTIRKGTGTWRTGYGYEGGGIWCRAGLTLSNNVIVENTAYLGSGIWCSGCAPIVVNNIIAGNGVCNVGKGGGFYCSSSIPTLVNNTLVGNAANMGGAIYLDDSYYGAGILTNNIVAFNSPGIFEFVKYKQTVYENNCVYGNTGYDYLGSWYRPTDISLDPLFRDAESGDYRLLPDSLCIDAGTNEGAPETDADGNPRPVDGDCDRTPVTDIGAYEYQPIPITIDIQPENSANNLKLQPNRMITVAILNGGILDLSTISQPTVVFGPGCATKVHKTAHWEDADDDGLVDLLFHFRCGECGIQPGDTTVYLYGRLTNGERIAGSDTINAIPAYRR